MQAIVFTEYGSPDVLKLREVDKPTPKDNEVLVKIHATSVNAADWHLMRASPALVRLDFGFFRPKRNILGSDIAGRVEAVGKDVRLFKVGQDVYGDISACGLGGFAEYVAVPEDALYAKPTNLTFEEAAAVPMAAITALNGLRDKGQLKAGQEVLINGAGGGVGTFTVQIAKALGGIVTAVCSTGKMDLMRSLGADHVIDYTREDFTKSSKQYDLIIGVNGYQPLSAYKRALKAGGMYVMFGGEMSQIFQALFLGALFSLSGGKKLIALMSTPNRELLGAVTELVQSGKIKPVMDRSYSLAEVPEAVRYVETGHAKGKVVIVMPNAGKA